MTDTTSNSTVNIALFVIQMVSAASGFVIAASCLFLRKWHPPIAYTAAFHISFWIGVQAIIAHTGSAISVRLPDSSEDMQTNKPLVRFLVWAQFAMPLWFVFLNAAIATDLMLSQLFRLNATKLQAVHKWYIPVTTAAAFTLALPLLIYHSAYRPESNVFSVQFPSALSVTLYYILAFDIWLAIGILYCFVVVSVVVGVLLVKLRRKRAAWRLQTAIQNSWPPLTPTAPANEAATNMSPGTDQSRATTTEASSKSAVSLKELENARREIEEQDNRADSDAHIDPNQVRTFTQPAPVAASGSIDARKTLLPSSSMPCATTKPTLPTHPSDTLMSGVTFNENTHVHMYHTERRSSLAEAKSDEETKNCRISKLYNSHCSDLANITSGCLPLRNSLSSTRSRIKSYLSSTKSDRHPSPCNSTSNQVKRYSDPTDYLDARNKRTRSQRLLIKLSSLPPQLTLRSRNRSLVSSGSTMSPFRIPTLALLRLLLYPLIPILSFTLMCIVRWVWFRSDMPSRWEILNVVSGFLRALEGFLCLIVFLLNPALNRSFHEIRKRNTPVFSR
ncbi:hypothetical protein BX667DRAFT_517137 [Coemansia mojavensis]|nr:hypothetical protein BX667DRAFT_517137 [Coemansia mojavensis]